MSRDLMEWIDAQQTEVQFTPLEMHWTNAAEKAVQTWKNHFLAGLASLQDEFPIAHWCCLIPQANLMLNLISPCRQNPTLSAQATIHGCYNFEATPMAPPGTKCFLHIKPHKRDSWGFHAEDAWYVGPALKHYLCYTVVMKQSTAQRIRDTVRFQHHNVQLPIVTPAEHIEKAAKELTNVVKANPTEGSANYVEVIQCLRAVVLGKKQQPRAQAKTVPQRNPSQSAEHPAIIKAMPTTA
jgi:hypothetical protein